MESIVGSVIEHRVKTVLLGDSGVGKTSFIECFKNGPRESKPAFVTTTGIYFQVFFIFIYMHKALNMSVINLTLMVSC